MLHTSSGWNMSLCVLCHMYVHTLTILLLPPALKPEIALFLPFAEGSFSQHLFKSFSPRLPLPLSQYTSFQHDLWVASKDARAGLRRSPPHCLWPVQAVLWSGTRRTLLISGN